MNSIQTHTHIKHKILNFEVMNFYNGVLFLYNGGLYHIIIVIVVLRIIIFKK